jgi:uncharacterized protein
MNDIPVKTGTDNLEQQKRCIAFIGSRCVASGELEEAALKIKAIVDAGEQAPILVFDEDTSEIVELDLRGTVDEMRQRMAKTGSAAPVAPIPEKRGPGRPKLGVVGREVTLLPRHWEWLDGQPGGASVALRKLVESAKRLASGTDRARISQEAVHRFLWAMAGNLPDFEEATRAFYARDHKRFENLVASWPEDIRNHVRKLVAAARRDETAAVQSS